MMNQHQEANAKASKFAASVQESMLGLLDGKLSATEFTEQLAKAVEAHDNVVYRVVAVATPDDLLTPQDFLRNVGLPHTAAAAPVAGLENYLQQISNRYHNNSLAMLPVWNVRHYGNFLVISEVGQNKAMYASVLERTGACRYSNLREAVQASYSNLATRSEVREVLVNIINRETDMHWKLTEAELVAGEIIPHQLAGIFPSNELLNMLAEEVRAGMAQYYNTPFTVRPSIKIGMIGMARCMEVCLEARDTEVLYRVKALMTLDSSDDFDKVAPGKLNQIHILEMIPDSGDRSRNEPVYLMSAKATRSLLDGHDLGHSLDDIRRVAKQQGWSDVQAFGQQLLFIS